MSRGPVAAAAVGAGLVLVPFAAVGAVFIIGWMVEGASRRRAQAELARKKAQR